MSEMDRADIKRQLEDHLFDGSGAFAYAVLDGARHLETLGMLEDSDVPFMCLHGGRLDPEVAITAPYIVELHEEDDLFDELFDDGWGDSRGIFLLSDMRLRQVRRHLRALTYAEMPDGEIVFFRFYDPRAMRVFMPAATPEQRAAMFGDTVETYFLENEAGDGIVTYEKNASGTTVDA